MRATAHDLDVLKRPVGFKFYFSFSGYGVRLFYIYPTNLLKKEWLKIFKILGSVRILGDNSH